MPEPRKPEKWPVVRAKYARWAWPFMFLEWLTEWLVFRLNAWAFVDLVKLVANLSIVSAAITYVLSGAQRNQALQEQRKAKHYQAWQVINLAQGKGGSGGRIDALQDLNRDSVSLAGVDLANAYLHNVQLPNASLQRANLQAADLFEACLEEARLESANLRGANLFSVNLVSASLSGADLRGADLSAAALRGATVSYADLRGASLVPRVKETVASIDHANVYGVTLAEPRFFEWALSNGAVCMASDEEWDTFKQRSPKSGPGTSQTLTAAQCFNAADPQKELDTGKNYSWGNVCYIEPPLPWVF